MIVVADTSVLLNLCRVGQVELLKLLFLEVVIHQISPVLDQLQRDAGFWITPALREHVLQLAGEKP